MVIDGDAHINEPMEAFERLLEEPFRARHPRIIKDTLGLTRILLEGRLYPEPRLRQAHAQRVEGTKLGGSRPGAADPVARLSDLDLDGIDVQVVYGSLGLAISSIRDRDFAVAMSRACNEYYAEFCSAQPDRLKCMATLPVQDVAAAVEEMRRAVTELGHVGVTVPPNAEGRELDDEYFRPIFEEAARLDVPVSVHWGNGSYLPAAGTERFDTHFMVHAIGHPFEQMIAMACIISGGVLDAVPGVRVAFLEAGCGWVPYWLERLHEHWERRGGEMPGERDPIEYVHEGRCYFAAEPDERLLPATVAMVGADHVLFSSDYPHSDSKFPESVKAVRERDDLSDQEKEKVLGANAERFYRIMTPVSTPAAS